jgi:hypothetical protein
MAANRVQVWTIEITSFVSTSTLSAVNADANGLPETPAI